MIDYLTGKIVELIVYEVKLHQADIEAIILEHVKELATLVTNYLENKDDDIDDEGA